MSPLRRRVALPHVRVEVSAQRSSVTLAVRGERLTGALREQLTALTGRGEVAVYDWEGSVVTPDGATAVLGFDRPADAAAARLLSQGPGVAAAGSLDPTDALALAAHLPSAGRPQLDAVSALCLRGEPCAIVVGPAPAAAAPRRPAQPALRQLAPAVRVAGDVTIVGAVTNGLVGTPVSERYFVLRGVPTLTGAQIVDSAVRTEAGAHAVAVRLTPAGTARFQSLTQTLAHRDREYGTTPDFSHFAVVLDGRLVSAPYLDSRVYPGGITTGMVEITGGLTAASARDLAAVLRFGALPLTLAPQ